MHWILIVSVFATAIALPLQQQLHLHMTDDERGNLLGAAPFHETPDYDLTTPFESDRDGAPDNRRRRDAADFVYFKVSAFGDEYHMEVKHSNDLLTPGFFVQIAGQTGESRLDFRNVEPCHFKGELKSHSPSHVAVSDCGDGLTGFIATNSTHLLLQPLPDHLVNSVANQAHHTHVVYKRAAAQTTTPTPNRQSYRAQCGVEGSIPPSYNDTKNEVDNKIRRGEPLDTERIRYVVEGLVVTDSGLFQKHGNSATKLTRYVVTIMNMASSMYNFFDLGYNVRLVLTRIYMFTDKKTEEKQNLYITHDSKNNLEGFSRWQSDPSRYIADDNDPLHYDHAFLFISKGMCYGFNQDCWELGRAWIGSVCSTGGAYAASVNADKGVQLGYVFAHELGHNLGMFHDGKDGQCSSQDGYIMAPSTSGAKKIHMWSECSKVYLLDNIKKNRLACLKDCPATIHSDFGLRPSYKLPGEVYDKDVQCQLAFSGSSGFCSHTFDTICSTLWCNSPDHPGSCTTSYVGAADGTPCGSGNKICFHGKCVKRNSIVLPLLPAPTICNEPSCLKDPSLPVVHGGWGPWEEQTTCSRSCGGGFQQETRRCINPSPQNCGENCDGESTRIAICNTQPCQHGTDYRAEQCTAINSRLGVTDLQPAYLDGQNNPCRLHCFSPSKRFQYRGTDVEDGTKCDLYSNNRCYRGDCQTVGCDNILGSSVQFDYCGVCGGDNITCEIVKGSYTQQQQRSAYYPVTVIPSGARRIRVEEIAESNAIIIAASVDGQRVLGVSLGAYDIISAAGTTFEYQRPSGGPEVLVIPGPTTEDIQLEAIIYGSRGPHSGLRYTYGTDTVAGHISASFFWRPKGFGSCNATCGGGVQTRRVVCRNPVTLKKTSDSDCASLVKPATAQSCNTHACPYWVTSDWFPCSVTCGRGSQSRTVKCKKAVKTDRCKKATKPRKKMKCLPGDCP